MLMNERDSRYLWGEVIIVPRVKSCGERETDTFAYWYYYPRTGIKEISPFF